MFLKLPIIGSAKSSKTESANPMPEKSSEISGSDKGTVASPNK